MFGAGAKQVCVEDLSKDISWKSKMKNVVKYIVSTRIYYLWDPFM